MCERAIPVILAASETHPLETSIAVETTSRRASSAFTSHSWDVLRLTGGPNHHRRIAGVPLATSSINSASHTRNHSWSCPPSAVRPLPSHRVASQ